MIVVADASAVLSVVLPDEEPESEIVDTLRSATLIAPPIWPAEIANSILIALRRNRIDLVEAALALAVIGEFGVEVAAGSLQEVAQDVFPLATRHGLTVYDATYLHLALSKSASLLTFDRALRKAARSEGVELR